MLWVLTHIQIQAIATKEFTSEKYFMEDLFSRLSHSSIRKRIFRIVGAWEENNEIANSKSANIMNIQYPMCHFLFACPKFKGKTVSQRRDFVKEYQCCFNCLIKHSKAKCSSKFSYRHYQQKHRTRFAWAIASTCAFRELISTNRVYFGKN